MSGRCPTKHPIVDESYLCTDTIRKRKLGPQNTVCQLLNRERGIGQSRVGTNVHNTRAFYRNVTPNLTVINVEKPAGFLRKFSPDGKYLIAFTFDQTSLEIYRFLGVSAAGHLLHGWRNDTVPNWNTGQAYEIRSKLFESLFRLLYVVNVSNLGKQLNRECSLFTKDNRYVIIGAANFITEDVRPHFYDLYTTNEAMYPTIRCPLENYWLYSIDLHTGQIIDQVHYKYDKIFLSHNQGLYLYNNTLAVLSVQHQTIHIYELLNGRFQEQCKIGRFCNDLEQGLYNAVYGTERPFREATINSLKHRFLTFLYRQAKEKTDETGNQYELRKFYMYFGFYDQLRIWKMQLLDDNHLLIKYSTQEVVMMKSVEPNSQIAYYVIYNIWKGEILAVYDNSSEELLQLFENFSDSFRNAQMHSDTQFPCSPNNNLYANLLQHRFKQSIVSARGGGMVEATKRILAQLPISAQSYSNSPYLDLSLFSYDDKWVSVMERPKACGEYPIRFFARDSGRLRFRIYPGLQQPKLAPSSVRRLVAFTFHPTEPFVISVQRIENDYVVNFHIRNPKWPRPTVC